MKSRFLILIALAAIFGCSKGGSDNTTGTTTTGTTTSTTGGASTTGTGGSTATSTTGTAGSTATSTTGTSGSTATTTGATGTGTPTTATGIPKTGAPGATGATGSTPQTTQSTASSSLAGPAYTLVLNPSNGEVAKYKVTADLPNGEVEAAIKTIYQVASGKISSTVQITSFNADKILAAMPADQRKQATTALNGMMKDMMAAKIKIVQDKTGKVITKDVVGSDNVKGFMQQFGGANNSPLPPHPVKVGESWTIPAPTKDVSDVTCKLIAVKTQGGHQVAVIGISVSAQGGKVTTAGTSTVDLKSGILILGTSDTKMTGADGKSLETKTSIKKI